MKVSNLTTEELKALIKEAVIEGIEELVEDPDKGLELREDVLEELKASLASQERTSVEDVARESGLKWKSIK